MFQTFCHYLSFGNKRKAFVHPFTNGKYLMLLPIGDGMVRNQQCIHIRYKWYGLPFSHAATQINAVQGMAKR